MHTCVNGLRLPRHNALSADDVVRSRAQAASYFEAAAMQVRFFSHVNSGCCECVCWQSCSLAAPAF